MIKYKLRPPQKIEKENPETGQKELVEDKDQHPEDRSIEQVEVIPDEDWNSLPDFAKEQMQKEKNLGNTTPANLKQKYVEIIDDIKKGIEQANEIATTLSEISNEFPELSLTGLPPNITAIDKISDLDSKKPIQRKKKE